MYKPFDLTGTTALVTGGNRGIGAGIAEALLQSGANVCCWGSSAERNAQACKKFAEYGEQFTADVVDVSDKAAVTSAFARLVEQRKAVHSVFANAGIGEFAPSFHEITEDALMRVISVNLAGLVWTLQEACAHGVKRYQSGDQDGMSLVGVASLAAIEGAARNQHYAATKGAVVSVMKGICVEYARYGIRANSMLPGWIATDMTAAAQESPAFGNKVLPRVPMRRWGTPQDFGGLSVYLASQASQFHSGDSLLVDGGYSVF